VAEYPNAQAPRPTEGDTELLEVSERPRFTLIDADGVVIDIANSEALRCRFERLLLDRCLSADQVRGLWEWNKAARVTIETQFGRKPSAPPPGALRRSRWHRVLRRATGRHQKLGRRKQPLGLLRAPPRRQHPSVRRALSPPIRISCCRSIRLGATRRCSGTIADRSGAASQGHEGIGSRRRLPCCQCRGRDAIAHQITAMDEADRRALRRVRNGAGTC